MPCAVNVARMSAWTLTAHNYPIRDGSLANAQQLTSPFLKARPGWLDDHRLVIRLFVQWFGTTRFIDLNELHRTIHPRCGSVRQGCAPQCNYDLGTAAMDLPASNLHNLADRNRFIAAQVEDSFEDEIGVQPGGTEGRRVAGLQGKSEEGSRVECPVVIGIARQDQAMSQSFEFLGLRFRHALRVPRALNWTGRGAIAIKRTYHAIRQTATAGGQMKQPRGSRAIAGREEPSQATSGGRVDGYAVARPYHSFGKGQKNSRGA